MKCTLKQFFVMYDFTFIKDEIYNEMDFAEGIRWWLSI